MSQQKREQQQKVRKTKDHFPNVSNQSQNEDTTFQMDKLLIQLLEQNILLKTQKYISQQKYPQKQQSQSNKLLENLPSKQKQKSLLQGRQFQNKPQQNLIYENLRNSILKNRQQYEKKQSILLENQKKQLFSNEKLNDTKWNNQFSKQYRLKLRINRIQKLNNEIKQQCQSISQEIQEIFKSQQCKINEKDKLKKQNKRLKDQNLVLEKQRYRLLYYITRIQTKKELQRTNFDISSIQPQIDELNNRILNLQINKKAADIGKQINNSTNLIVQKQKQKEKPTQSKLQNRSILKTPKQFFQQISNEKNLKQQSHYFQKLAQQETQNYFKQLSQESESMESLMQQIDEFDEQKIEPNNIRFQQIKK